MDYRNTHSASGQFGHPPICGIFVVDDLARWDFLSHHFLLVHAQRNAATKWWPLARRGPGNDSEKENKPPTKFFTSFWLDHAVHRQILINSGPTYKKKKDKELWGGSQLMANSRNYLLFFSFCVRECNGH